MTSFRSPDFRIRSYLGSAKEIDVSEHIVRTKALGEELDFSDLESSFVEFQEIAAELSEAAWHTLPESIQTSVLGTIQNLQSAYFAITEFSAVEGQNKQAQLAIDFEQRLNEFKETALPYAGYLLWSKSGADDRARSLLREVENALIAVREKQGEAEGKNAALDELVKAAREAVPEIGVEKEKESFKRAADRYEYRSLLWLGASVLLLVGTIGAVFGLVLLWDLSGKVDEANVLQLVLAKAVALAVLSYATITAVRLFKSNAHLAAVNRHREDSLSTFRSFLEGTETVEVRDKILLAASHAAFGQSATGLLGDKAEGNNTIEVLDGIAGGLIRRP